MHKLDLTEPIPADFKLPPLPKRNRADQARINGAKSQGPITEDGKFICSRGALKHGLTALKHTVLDIEDPDEFLAFQTATIDEFRPKSVFALSLVEQLAHLQWTLDRLNLIHTAYLNHKVNEAANGLDPLAETAQGTNEIAALVRGWIASAVNGSAIDLLRRYTATLQHQFNSTFNNLHKLEQQQAARLRDRDLPYQKPELPKPVPEARVETKVVAIDRDTPTSVAAPIVETLKSLAPKHSQNRRPSHQPRTPQIGDKCS